MKDGGLRFIALSSDKKVCPDHFRHCIVNSDELTFGGTPSVDPLFLGGIDYCSFSKIKSQSRVPFEVSMDGEGGIDPPAHHYV